MGDKKTFTDEEIRRQKKLLQAYISQSKWDESMNIKREHWLWERPIKKRLIPWERPSTLPYPLASPQINN